MKLTYLRATITFSERGEFEIRQVLQNRGCMLYHICENEPKIPILTFISDLQGKPVKKCAASFMAANTPAEDSSSRLVGTTVMARRSERFSI